MLASLLQVFLTLILVLQLASLSVSPEIKSISYGLVHINEQAESKFFNAKPTTVTYASVDSATKGIVFVGDVLLARNVEFLMGKEGAAYPFAGFDLDFFPDKTYAVGNFESAVPREHNPTDTGEMVFSVSEKYLQPLRDAGFTHMSLANNHSYDFGEIDYLHTVTKLAESGVASFGHPNHFGFDSVTFLPIGNKTIALIGLSTLENVPQPEKISEVLSFAEEKSDLQIVFVHWGTEYELTNNDKQEKLASELIVAGTDLIIGHHPHVVQNISRIHGVPVLYSLGNYIFDQYDTNETQHGLVAYLDLSSEPTLNLIPVTSEGTLSQPRQMTEAESLPFLREIAERSDIALRASIARGSIYLDTPVATSPKMAMINR